VPDLSNLTHNPLHHMIAATEAEAATNQLELAPLIDGASSMERGG
jgi:hypothetical protein